MSTLLEIEAAADALPFEQQEELCAFLSSRLSGPANEATANSLRHLEQQFAKLTEDWRAATAFTSSLTEMSAHPAYQRIIGMGRLALHMIFRELAQEPDHWFWALKAITGCDPVEPPHRGNIDLMAADWLAWGRSRGYLQP